MSPTSSAPRPGRTTLAMLADEAGVSLSTISKVLNGRTDVAVELKSYHAFHHGVELSYQRKFQYL